MRYFKIVFYFLLSSVLFACNESGWGKHNGKIVIDSNGDYYLIEHKAGLVYYVRDYNHIKAQIDSVNAR
jgi:hypothetical protein